MTTAPPAPAGILAAFRLALVALVAVMAPAAAQMSTPAKESDWSQIAKTILHRSLQLAPGERVIIHYLPGQTPALVQALRSEIISSGAIISAELTWPTQEMAPYFESLSPQQKARLAESQNTVYREIFARSDVYLWLHESPLDDLIPRQFERLISESKVRAIHCHFMGAPNPHTQPELWQMYLRAIDMDPAQLQHIEDSLARQLRASRLHLTSPQGTDLTFEVAPDAWFHENTGDASRSKPRNPLSTRDREEEIPGGALRTTAITGADGKLVATVNGSRTDSAVLTFRNGRLVKVEPHGKEAEAFARWYASTAGDRDRIGELVIGNNPYLVPVAAANSLADFGYRSGTVRLDIGENWESGGALRTGDHQQWAFIIADATLKTQRAVLIARGQPAHQL